MFFKENQLANNPFCKTLTWEVIAALLSLNACSSSTRFVNTHPDVLRNELKKGEIVKITTKDDRDFEKFKITEVTLETIIGKRPTASGREGPEQKILFSEIANLEKIKYNRSQVVAKEDLQVRPGDRVRVSTSDAQATQFFVGPLVALDAYTLFLENELALPLGSVTKLELYWGQKSNAGKGAFIGFLVGAGFGAIMGGSSAEWASGEWAGTGLALVAGAVFGLIGTLLGGLVGAAKLGDIWQEVPLENVRQSSLK